MSITLETTLQEFFVPVADKSVKNHVQHLDGNKSNDRPDNLLWVPYAK